MPPIPKTEGRTICQQECQLTKYKQEIERWREAHETVSKIVDGMTLHFVERGKKIERLRNALLWALPYVKTDEKVNDIVCAALKEGE